MGLHNRNRVEGSRMANLSNPSLCWDCKKAASNGDCCWASSGKPVTGWKAVPTVVNRKRYPFSSFHVVDCPDFCRDAYDGGQQKAQSSSPARLDDDSVKMLSAAIIERAALDLKALGDRDKVTIDGKPVKRSELQRFFKSSWFEDMMCSVTDRPPAAARERLGV